MATIAGPSNTAAWALKPKSRPLVVSSAPYPSPPPGHVAVKVVAVAVNPIDWIMQDQDIFGAKYPAVFGSDIAGEIEQVGEGVVDLEVGQRVIAHANSLSTNNPSHGAFQQHAIVPRLATSPYPPSFPPEHAAVLPLSISTAAAGLYQRHYLHLPFPNPDPSTSTTKPLHRVVLIWGGSSSVGSTAIQLARASGATVFAVASDHNASYCRRLGASLVFDYHRENVENLAVRALRGSTLAGVYHAAGDDDAVRACARIAERCQGKALVVTVRRAPSQGIPKSVRVRAISSSDVFREGNEAGRIWTDFVPKALESGALVPAPLALVVGEGLRSVQNGLDVQRRGVSANKVVVANIDEDASSRARSLRVLSPIHIPW